MIEKVVEQRKIIITNFPMIVIENKKYSYKQTLAEARLIRMPAFKHMHYTSGNCGIFVPQEPEDTQEVSARKAVLAEKNSGF